MWDIVAMEIRKTAAVPMWLIVVAALVATGCGAEPQPDVEGMKGETYVQVMTELMLLDATPPAGDTPEELEARADSARSEILNRHGVTAREMLDYAVLVGGEAGRMEELWKRITEQYDSTRLANLRGSTEARSESEGKLGTTARTGAAARGGADETTKPPGGVADTSAKAALYSRMNPDSLLRARRRMEGQTEAPPAPRDSTLPHD